jgi:hypothetical protein
MSVNQVKDRRHDTVQYWVSATSNLKRFVFVAVIILHIKFYRREALFSAVNSTITLQVTAVVEKFPGVGGSALCNL